MLPTAAALATKLRRVSEAVEKPNGFVSQYTHMDIPPRGSFLLNGRAKVSVRVEFQRT
jgi:hypothetical protein